MKYIMILKTDSKKQTYTQLRYTCTQQIKLPANLKFKLLNLTKIIISE